MTATILRAPSFEWSDCFVESLPIIEGHVFFKVAFQGLYCVDSQVVAVCHAKFSNDKKALDSQISFQPASSIYKRSKSLRLSIVLRMMKRLEDSRMVKLLWQKL
jgi:hypothetical protein